ncbi:MAG: 3-methyl-2-oxobutanoate hydroxymethyltransferase [Vulcanimicrobiota bacterium]
MSTVSSLPGRGKTTVLTLQAKKRRGEPISMITAYDYPTALAVDQAEFDVILVGDSLGMVVLGYENTLPVTMADMLHHCKAVARGARRPMLVGDMPFMSYQASVAEAVTNAGRFLQEAGMDAVKLEGGVERVEAVRAIVAAGIPVMGHIGLTPQALHQLGGFRTQGKTAETARRLVEAALALEAAGCFSLVLEAVPPRLAELISQKLTIPTIGIGAGADCDGQVLVIHDMLGLFDRFTPRFVKQYAQLNQQVHQALVSFREEIEQRQFPAAEHTVAMPEEEWVKLLEQEPAC